MFDNDKKLNLEIFENKELNLPSVILSGDSSMELLNPYLDLIKIPNKKGESLLKARFLTLGVPAEYWQFHLIGKMKSIICVYLVNAGKARWLSFDHEALNPETAINSFRNSNCKAMVLKRLKKAE